MKKKGPVDGTEFSSITVQMVWKNLIFINKQPHLKLCPDPQSENRIQRRIL
jgi:hypothetical protein